MSNHSDKTRIISSTIFHTPESFCSVFNRTISFLTEIVHDFCNTLCVSKHGNKSYTFKFVCLTTTTTTNKKLHGTMR